VPEAPSEIVGDTPLPDFPKEWRNLKSRMNLFFLEKF
jgi:hypothetical protein